MEDGKDICGRLSQNNGMVVLPVCYFHNFRRLCVAISIFYDETRMYYLNFAEQLLYGETLVTYNVHFLIHLADDCRKFGKSLNSLSAFPFKSYLGQLK